jgi:type IV secretion system protein VirB5
VLNEITQIDNQLTQIQTAANQLTNASGVRGLGNFANSPAFHDYIPRDALAVLNDVEAVGYGGMQGTGKALRDASMIYNCQAIQDPQQNVRCQSNLARPYQEQGFFKDAQDTSKTRMDQISQLLAAAANAPDDKDTQEVNSRLLGETAMLVHENTEVQLTAAQAAAQARIEQSRASEAMLERASRTGSASDYFHF